MSKTRESTVRAAPQRNTASSCRSGCGSITLDMWTGRAGWQRQPCPIRIIYSQQVGLRWHLLTWTHRAGTTVRSVFRCRRIHLPSPPKVAGQVKPRAGLRCPLSHSGRRRRTVMHRDQVKATGFPFTVYSPGCKTRGVRQSTELLTKMKACAVVTVLNVTLRW